MSGEDHWTMLRTGNVTAGSITASDIDWSNVTWSNMTATPGNPGDVAVAPSVFEPRSFPVVHRSDPVITDKQGFCQTRLAIRWKDEELSTSYRCRKRPGHDRGCTFSLPRRLWDPGTIKLSPASADFHIEWY